MFCSNCGNPLTEGAKFCSECGTKVEEPKVRDFGTLSFDEPTHMADTLAGSTMGAEEAFDSRVSFDWSNVIDEPQRREIPQGIKSPWAATTDSISERQLYAEMTQSDDKNRTMSFIDVLRADKEERERAAAGRSMEYTEVLEIDPELGGGTRPPELRMAPLYEDVDAPVITPFDDMENSGETEEIYDHSGKLSEVESDGIEDAYLEQTSTEAPKFELPEFLRKAADFDSGKDEDVEIQSEAVEAIQVEEPDSEDLHVNDEEIENPTDASTHMEDAENAYLDEDLYLELSEEPRSDRISRIVAHADEYESEEESENEPEPDADVEAEVEIEEISEYASEPEADRPLDENELFSEMTEPEHDRASMRIAAPADEEAEIEALKRRLAELTGTIEIDPELLSEEETKPQKESEPEIPEQHTEPLTENVEEPLTDEATDVTSPVSEEEPEEAEEGSFEALGADFAFEPEITEADNEMFAALTAASESAIETPSFGLASDNAITDENPETADELSAVEAAFGLPVDAEPETIKSNTENATEEHEPTVEDLLAKYVPQYFGDKADETATNEGNIAVENDDAVLETKEDAETVLLEGFSVEPVDDDSPIVGFAPAITEAPSSAVETDVSVENRGTISLEDFMSDTTETAKPAEPVPVYQETKTTDAVSLEELEKDIFGPVDSDDVDAETTKKIDKFYTLYRKNEEFQRLLDEEYNRLKGDAITIPEDSMQVPDSDANASGAVLEELTANSRPVEDATIYRVDSADGIEKLSENPNANPGFSVGGEEVKSFGLDGAEASDTSGVATEASTASISDAAGAAAATVAGTAGAVALTKAEKRAAKKAEKQKKKEQAAAQTEYEEVDGGSTILTVLAVIVAILLVILLAIILILHVAPNSEIAITIDQFIENMTGHFSAFESYDIQRFL